MMTKKEWNSRYSKKFQDCESFMQAISGNSTLELLRHLYNCWDSDSIALADAMVDSAVVEIRKEMSEVQSILNQNLTVDNELDIAKAYFG